MKKEVQALLKRRRSPRSAMPAIFAGCAVLVILLMVFILVATFTSEAGQALFRGTSTPTITATSTAPPATATPSLTFTPAATSTTTETPGPTPTRGPQTYEVQSGDTVFGIATEFGVDFCLLMAVNSITDPANLAIGTALIIPGDDTVLPSPTPLPPLARGARIKYIVQCGDTLETIASKFNSTPEDIASTNKITDPLSIQIGQELDVRVNLVTPTPTLAATATVTPTPTP